MVAVFKFRRIGSDGPTGFFLESLHRKRDKTERIRKGSCILGSL